VEKKRRKRENHHQNRHQNLDRKTSPESILVKQDRPVVFIHVASAGSSLKGFLSLVWVRAFRSFDDKVCFDTISR
jgi:hypothetical protein